MRVPHLALNGGEPVRRFPLLVLGLWRVGRFSGSGNHCVKEPLLVM